MFIFAVTEKTLDMPTTAKNVSKSLFLQPLNYNQSSVSAIESNRDRYAKHLCHNAMHMACCHRGDI